MIDKTSPTMLAVTNSNFGTDAGHGNTFPSGNFRQLEALATSRLVPLVRGQLHLVASRVRDTIEQGGEYTVEVAAQLNHIMVDFKDWLDLVSDRCQSEAFCAPRVTAEVNETLSRIRSALSDGEWLGLDWFREEFPRAMLDCTRLLDSTSGQGTPLAVGEYQLFELPTSLRGDISTMCLRRTIDQGRNEPQKGLEFRVTPDLLDAMVAPQSTILWTLSYESKVVGIFLVYLDSEPLSEGCRAIVDTWCQRSGVSRERVCYGELVVTDPHFSEAARALGLHGYRTLMRSATQSLVALGIDTIVGEVRVGENANLSMMEHEAVGYLRTGLRRPHHGITLELVEMAISKGAKLGSLTPSSFADAGGRDSDHLGPLEFLGRPEHIARAYPWLNREFADPERAATFAREQLERLGLGDRINVRLRPALSGGKACLSFELDYSILSIFQHRREFDEWRSQMFPTVFRTGKISTFREVVSDCITAILRNSYGWTRSVDYRTSSR